MKYRSIIIVIAVLSMFTAVLTGNNLYAEEEVWGSRDDENIVIKSLIVNPSKTQSQKVPFKSYLPKEIRPEYIIDAGGLKIEFDYQKGQYFAHAEFELKPEESKTIRIILKDIWKIPKEEVEAFKNRSDELLKKMEGTDFYDRASFFKNNIDGALSKIEQKMAHEPLTPLEQMKQYREIMALFSAIKSDMAASEAIEEGITGFTPKAAWKIIITITVSLGVLSSVFFYLWYVKIKPNQSIGADRPIITQIKPTPPPEAEKKVAKEEKKIGIDDIENALKKKTG